MCKLLWLELPACECCNIVGALENEDGWKWSLVIHEGVLHVWGPFTPKWDKFK